MVVWTGNADGIGGRVGRGGGVCLFENRSECERVGGRQREKRKRKKEVCSSHMPFDYLYRASPPILPCRLFNGLSPSLSCHSLSTSLFAFALCPLPGDPAPQARKTILTCTLYSSFTLFPRVTPRSEQTMPRKRKRGTRHRNFYFGREEKKGQSQIGRAQ